LLTLLRPPPSPRLPYTTLFRSELAQLRSSFDESVATRSATLATIVGTPGIGKSRLARELLGGLRNDARVLVGRCTSYGEGVPYLERKSTRLTPVTSLRRMPSSA